MKEVDVSSIDASKIRKLNVLVHSESDLFRDGKTVYKIFKELPKSSMAKKEKKIEIISSIKGEPHLVLPKEKLIGIYSGKRRMCGYSMDFIKGKTLFELEGKLATDDYLRILRQVSETIRANHKGHLDLVFGDLSFFNIMIDKNLNHYLVDLDNVTIEGLASERISPLASEYYAFRNTKLSVNRNFDRLTILLYFLDSIFYKGIQEVSNYEYDRQAERLKVLNEIRSLVLELKKEGRKVPYIPYLDEVIEIPKRTLVI